MSVINQLKVRPKLIVIGHYEFLDGYSYGWPEAGTHKVDVLLETVETLQLSGEYSLVKAANKILGWGQVPDHQKRRTFGFAFPR